MTASAGLVPSTPRRTTFDTGLATPSFTGGHYSANRRHSLYGTEDRIVLDPGCRTWRVGFSGEGRPRDVFPAHKPVSFTEPREKERTSLWDLDMGSSMEDREEAERALYERLKDRLRKTFMQSLMVDPKGRKVIVAENPLLPVCIKEMIARILFKNLQVPSVSFAPSGLLALLASGRTTGLVVDIGHLETTILPIYQARPLYPKLRSTPLGGARLSSHLRDLLLLFGGYYAPPDLKAPASQAIPGMGSVPEDVLTDDVLDDIKVRCCYVEDPLPRRRRREVQEPGPESDELDVTMLDAPPPDTAVSSATASPHISESHPTPLHAMRALYSAHTSCTDIRYTLKNRGTLSIPGWVRSRAAELFFASGDVDEASLPELILSCLASLNADLRKVFVGRILVIGGTAAMRGLIARLETELEKMAAEPVHSQIGFPRHPEWTTDPWVAVRHLKGKFRVVNNPQRPTGEGKAPGWSPGSMVWVGGSLAGALKLSGEEIPREKYDEAEKAARRAAVLAESGGAEDEEDESDEDVDMDIDEDESDAWKRGYRLPDWTRAPLPQGAPMAPRRIVAAA
ncbi:actin-like ATPase domain-containing protein [Calocera viscosa TUFC12733]|uniref:Actin-like ATPase domain-containing protein n=1 Tax=Calocera viscosa (strain TUFC12733) TaxID=1330018 RepID=A0A167GL51_CALVF|nr:actin-like ATPase domain-containing protein [Calocera viscosa TUFC12733]